MLCNISGSGYGILEKGENWVCVQGFFQAFNSEFDGRYSILLQRGKQLHILKWMRSDALNMMNCG